MSNLVIDVGNSHIKAGLFGKGELLMFYETGLQKELIEFAKRARPDHIVICSVAKSPEVLKEILSNYARKVYVLDYRLPLPITNLYETPETLGMDRVAGVAGAKVFFPYDKCLVIDTGTCIKYDFIDHTGNYWGGMISPGMNMRFQAMHQFTAKLPLLNPPENNIELIGRNTQEAMQSGVMNGMVAEIEGIIREYQHKAGEIKVLLCGGDSHFFETKIKSSIFAVPKLVLVGLDSILQHNVIQK